MWLVCSTRTLYALQVASPIWGIHCWLFRLSCLPIWYQTAEIYKYWRILQWWEFGLIPRESLFQSWMHSTMLQSLQCSLCFVLGTISNTCPRMVSLLETLLMPELSFLESYYSGRKALWSSCGDMLTRAESDKMRTLNWYPTENVKIDT